MEGQEMCGRFYIDDETAKEIEKIARRIDHKMAKMGEVHPSEPALILRAQKGETVSEVLQWGYGGAGKIIFNVRSESVQERPMFRHDYENRRCIIPAKKFYEWDALFREAKEDKSLQEEYVQLLRGLFRSSLTDKMIEAAYMTGILPIKKYGNQSALSDFYEFTMVDSSPLEEYVGFTEDEVRKLCEESSLDFHEMQHWYDGYILGDHLHIYNPKSVLDAINRKRFGSYWAQTETYESLRTYITMNFDGLKDMILSMLGGMKCKIDTNTFQNDMTTFRSRDDVLTLLVHLGYLAYDVSAESVFIPNQEVTEEFLRAIKNADSPELIQVIRQSEQLLDATLHMDEETVARLLDKIHTEYTSPLFYNNEQSLRAVIQLAYISRVKDYLEFQELPSGQGYADSKIEYL